MIVLLLIVFFIFIVSTSAAEERLKSFKIDNSTFMKSKIHSKIESNLLKEKSDAFKAQLQNQNTIKVVFELKGSDESYIKSLKDSGAIIEAVHKNLVQASIQSSQLYALSKLPVVNYVRSPLKPYKDAVVSEGVGVINASLVHNSGFKGQGVKIAIIDHGFAGYTSKLGTELPGSVTAISFRADGDITGGGEDHGTGVAEIVYDVAPDAELYLINFDTDVEFGNAVDYLISQNVDIVSMSGGWLVGPFNGTGDMDEIVDTATSSGIVWVNSAGNYAQRHWEGKYSGNGDDWHDFIPGDELMSLGYLTAGTPVAVYLSWDDWPISYQDYDMCLVDGDGYIVDCSVNNQSAGFAPYENLVGIILSPDNFYLAINKYSATRDVNFELYSAYQNLEHQVASSSLSIPADARDVITTGATYWLNDALESFSSQGPTNDGRIKPDVVAPDGVSTSIPILSPFYGTSASAPHAAGAVALLLDVNPSLTPETLRSALESTAKDLGTVGKDNLYGSGRIDLWAAISPPAPTGGTVISIANVTTTQNTNVTRSIMVENVNNIVAATINLAYDPSVVNVLSVSSGDLGGVTANINNTKGNTTMSAFSTTTAKSGNITFASILLRAAGAVNATSPLTLSVPLLANQNGMAISHSIRSGVFTISAAITFDPADSNQDHAIDINELMTVIGLWKAGSYSIDDLMTSIARWKAGGY